MFTDAGFFPVLGTRDAEMNQQGSCPHTAELTRGDFEKGGIRGKMGGFHITKVLFTINLCRGKESYESLYLRLSLHPPLYSFSVLAVPLSLTM